MPTKSLLTFAIAIFLFSACSGDSAETDAKDESGKNLKETDSASAGVDPKADFRFHTMIANLPTPSETFQMLQNTEIDNGKVSLTETSKASGLSTQSQKAFGYGVFITDMSFLAYQKDNQGMLTYLQTCRQLAKDLGAGEVFDRAIASNLDQEEAGEESFVKVMDEGFTAMDEYMKDNERFLNATEIFLGSWVESQLIATKMLQGEELNEGNKNLYEGIYAQKLHASNLMNVLGEVDNEIPEDVRSSVEDLMMFYAGFSSPESWTPDDLKALETKLMALKSTLIG